MKIRTQLIMTNLLTALFVLLSGFIGIYATYQTKERLDQVIEQRLPLYQALQHVRAGSLRIVALVSEYGFVSAEHEYMSWHSIDHHADQAKLQLSLQSKQEIVSLLRRSETDLLDALTLYKRQARLLHKTVKVPQQHHLVSQIEQDSRRLLAVGLQLVAWNIQGMHGAEMLQKEMDFAKQERSLIKLIDQAVVLEEDALKQEQQRVKHLLEYLLYIMTAFVALAMILAVVISALQYKMMFSPLRKLEASTRQVGLGELDTCISDAPDNELGMIAQAFNKMVRRLKVSTLDLVTEKERAESANRLKSEFLANMSHELRTPMHSVLSFAQLGIKKSALGERHKLASYFDRIHGNGQRLMQLLDRLLDLAKLEAGKMPMEYQECCLDSLIKHHLRQFEAMFTEKALHVRVNCPDRPFVAALDEFRIGQVLNNILVNAQRYSPPDGEILISLAEVQIEKPVAADSLSLGQSIAELVPMIELRIADQGEGIPEAELETVFDKFIQSSKTSSGAGGTGLGLAICKEITEAHHGQITAHNRREGGAEFKLLLPFQPPTMKDTS